MIRADLHVHTSYSPDASTPPKIIVDQLYTHSNIKAVAITDHNTMEGYYKAKELAAEHKDIAIIPGVEISTTEGEIIVLGVEELPPTPWTVRSVINFAKNNGGITIAVHPYRGFGLGDLARNYNLDAIEVLNAITPANANRLAEDLARTMHLPGVAGTDAHQPSELWSVYTEIQAPLDVARILEAIKNGFVKVSLADKSIRF